ncbi:MAG: ABC transporter ATP-binding protein [Chloroflexi bacterium]|nr:ABC transporter ATP-binding protein [Chloroflexota bacterium]
MTVYSSIIFAEGIHKIYDTGKLKVPALQGVNLAVEEGEMVAIMGPSGCGKTTLLNCLSGLDDIDEGVISIAGTDLATLSDNQKTRYRATSMGYIFQAYNLLPVLTARGNVELPLLVSGTDANTARDKAMAALDLVGLSERERHYPSELSGGQQQRVTIARALVNEPEIVWGDEPTGNLDSENSGEIMDLLTKLNKENRQTFIIVTHSDEVAARAHRIVRMQDGVVVDDGRKATAAAG